MQSIKNFHESDNMPFIMSKVSVSLNSAQEFQLKSRLGKAMEILPGLSEKYLLAGFESNQHFYLRGDNTQPIAFIEVSIFSNENHVGYEEFSAEVMKIFVNILNISPQNVYIKFADIPCWSVVGLFFDRR